MSQESAQVKYMLTYNFVWPFCSLWVWSGRTYCGLNKESNYRNHRKIFNGTNVAVRDSIIDNFED